jgi:hypothetical protein
MICVSIDLKPIISCNYVENSLDRPMADSQNGRPRLFMKTKASLVVNMAKAARQDTDQRVSKIKQCR